MKFGDYIRSERERKGWTQPEAAEACGIEQSYLSKLENGKAVPGAEVFEKLSKGFDLSLKAMAEEIDHPELEKLRDVEAIRKMLKQKATGQARTHRFSLLAGATFVVLGAGMLAHAVWVERNNSNMVEYIYESKGVIKEGESPYVFKSMPSSSEMANISIEDYESLTLTENQRYDAQMMAFNQALLAAEEDRKHLNPPQATSLPQPPRLVTDNDKVQLVSRLDYKEQRFVNRIGDIFISQVDGGSRTWNLVDAREKQHTPDTAPYFILGIMSLVAGFMSFLVGWRWR